VISLQRMAESEFPAFFEAASDSYARDNAASGRWSESDAPSLAREETRRLLPQAERTPDNELFVIRDTTSSTAVGYVWYGSLTRGTKKVAFLFQLYILRSTGAKALEDKHSQPSKKRLGTLGTTH
jgi:hypothetical protein